MMKANYDYRFHVDVSEIHLIIHSTICPVNQCNDVIENVGGPDGQPDDNPRIENYHKIRKIKHRFPAPVIGYSYYCNLLETNQHLPCPLTASVSDFFSNIGVLYFWGGKDYLLLGAPLSIYMR